MMTFDDSLQMSKSRMLLTLDYFKMTSKRARGEDTSTVTCSACLPGLHARDGECVECGGGDYALVFELRKPSKLCFNDAFRACERRIF